MPPLFRKSSNGSTDRGTMMETHRKVLRRCRQILIKDLDISVILDKMATVDDGFKVDQREVSTATMTREEKIGMFLDRLESRGERAFGMFMEALREHQRHLHAVLQEAFRTVGDPEQKERITLSGEVVRKLLHKNIRRHVLELSDGGRVGGGMWGSDAGSIGELLEEKENEQYIDCFTLTTRGRVQREKWIKHFNADETTSSLTTRGSRERTYAAVLAADTVFKSIDVSVIKPFVCSLPLKTNFAYILDTEYKATKDFSKTNGRFSFNNSSMKSARWRQSTSNRMNRSGVTPPPVPPKPNHLQTMLPPVPPTLKFRKNGTVLESSDVPMLRDRISAKRVNTPPPLPPGRTTKIPIALTKSGHIGELSTVRRAAAVLPNSVSSAASGSGTETRLLTAKDEDDYNSLNYNVSACSHFELVFDADSKCSADSSGCAVKAKLLDEEKQAAAASQLVRKSSDKSASNGGSVLPTYGSVDVGKKKNQNRESVDSSNIDPIVSVNPQFVSEGSQIANNIQTQDIDLSSHDKEKSEIISETGSTMSHDSSSVKGADVNRNYPLDNGSKKEETATDVKRPHLVNVSDNGTDSQSSDGESVSSVRLRRSSSSHSPRRPVPDPEKELQFSITERPLTDPVSRRAIQKDRQMVQSLTDIEVLAEDDDSSTDHSYYEEIGGLSNRCHSPSQRSSATYLDPRSSSVGGYSRTPRPWSYRGEETLPRGRPAEPPGRKIIVKGTILVAEVVETSPRSNGVQSNAVKSSSESNVDSSSVTDSQLPIQCSASTNETVTHVGVKLMDTLRGTTLAYDKEGNAFYIPTSLLTRYGDPCGERWFYPIPISSRQATLFLSDVRVDGCFIVYRLTDDKSGSSASHYNLSVCRQTAGNGDVVHYRIVENAHGDYMISGHDHSFMTLKDLVNYFQCNKSSLATRLRRCLQDVDMPITPGYHYPAKYELEVGQVSLTGKIIGKGAFGVVCGGTYRSSPVAVKVLQKPDASLAEEDEFIEEAKTMSGLHHDNIVRLIGVRCTMRPMFIVTEYMSKGSLKDYLRSRSISSDNISSLFNICVQVVSAMQYLESVHFVLHRDLAARNFLVSSDLRVKLADFGRARAVFDDAYQAERSERISVKWASPEVLLDSHYSTKSDVWAAGVVFWEVFSLGERPFPSLTGEQTAVYVIEGGRLDKPPSCPPNVYSLMQRCWKDDPAVRPSFSQLQDKLKKKSSIYYYRPTQSVSAAITAASSSASKPSSSVSAKKRKPASSSTGYGSHAVTSTVKQSNTSATTRKMIEYLRDELESRNEVPTSSSDTSLHSYSGGGCAMSGGELKDGELQRGDKFRKTLSRLMKINTNKPSKPVSGTPSPSRPNKVLSDMYT